MNKESFGNFIKELRKDKKYTQQELADLLFIDVSAISKWERGVSYPDITLISRLCEALDIDEHELIKCSKDFENQRLKLEGLKFLSIKNIVFWTMSILYSIAIITCFIVNICVSKNLSWFFIVLASCVSGFMFFPTVVRFIKKDKFLWYVLSTFISLVILYLTCSIYTSNYWWLVASFGTLLGYFLIFYPIIYNKKILYINDKYEYIKKFFWITYALGLLLLTIVLLVTINCYTVINFKNALFISIYSYLVLLIIGIVRLLNVNRYIRMSIDFFLSIFHIIGLGKLLIALFGNPDEYSYKVNFSDWPHYTNGNVVCLIIAILLLMSLAFCAIGIIIQKKKIFNESQKNNNK